MKIKIIKGVYGHRENGVVIPKDKNCEPFEIADTRAVELIKAGIAEKADGLKSEAEKPIRYSESLAPVDNLKKADKDKSDTGSDETGASANSGDDNSDDDDDTLEYSMENTQKELLAMARELGFDGKDTTTKAELIAFLDEVTNDEDAPQIGDDAGAVD